MPEKERKNVLWLYVWQPTACGSSIFICSKCKGETNHNYTFCPHCGEMIGGDVLKDSNGKYVYNDYAKVKED